MECLRKDGYHVDDFNIYFEMLDPDENGYGELVATTLSRRTMPFIRYRVHDVTRFIENALARAGLRCSASSEFAAAATRWW